MHHTKRIACAVPIVLALLGGCGGGGSSSSSSGSVTSSISFDLGQAKANLSANGVSQPVDVSGKVNSVDISGSGTITESPATASTFEGQTALRVTGSFSGSVSGGGQTIPLGVSAQVYATTNYVPLGEVLPSGEYWVAQAGSTSVPTTVKVNDTAVTAKFNRYSDSSKTTLLGTAVRSYVIEPDTSKTAIAKFLENEYDTSKTQVSSSQTSYRIDQFGSVTWLSEAETLYPASGNSGNLDFKPQ